MVKNTDKGVCLVLTVDPTIRTLKTLHGQINLQLTGRQICLLGVFDFVFGLFFWFLFFTFYASYDSMLHD